MQGKQILIIEDDKDISDMLTKLLTAQQYRVKKAYSGTEALLVHNERTDLILLDLMLPGKSGEEIIRELKGIHPVPIIVMSAIDRVHKKVDVLELGASDYITKPFHNDEMLARIKVQLRDQIQGRSPVLKFRDIELDTRDFTVRCNGQRVPLAKSIIFDHIWNEENSADDNTLNVHISKIKSKLKACHPGEDYIETVWSIGYRMKKND